MTTASDSVAALARKGPVVKAPLAGDGRAVLLQVILWSHPYVRDGDF